jgi:hypothetical protein
MPMIVDRLSSTLISPDTPSATWGRHLVHVTHAPAVAFLEGIYAIPVVRRAFHGRNNFILHAQ